MEIHGTPWITFLSHLNFHHVDKELWEPDTIRDGPVTTTPLPSLLCLTTDTVVASTVQWTTFCTWLGCWVSYTGRCYPTDEGWLTACWKYMKKLGKWEQMERKEKNGEVEMYLRGGSRSRTKSLLNCSKCKSFKIGEVLVLILILIQIWRTRKSFLNPPLYLFEFIYHRKITKSRFFNLCTYTHTRLSLLKIEFKYHLYFHPNRVGSNLETPWS